MKQKRDQRLSSLVRRQDGLAAIEFAMVLPVMIIMLMGTIELSNLLTAERRAESVAATLADLVARDDSVTEAEISDVFFAAESVMADMDSSSLQMVITSIEASGGSAVVGWSRAKNTAPDATGSTVSDLPSGIMAAGGSIIRVRVTYPYKLMTMGSSNYKQTASGYVAEYDMGNAHTINKTFYMRPRLVPKIPNPT